MAQQPKQVSQHLASFLQKSSLPSALILDQYWRADFSGLQNLALKTKGVIFSTILGISPLQKQKQKQPPT